MAAFPATMLHECNVYDNLAQYWRYFVIWAPYSKHVSQWLVYENLALHWRSCDTSIVQQPWCTNENYSRILHDIEDILRCEHRTATMLLQNQTYTRISHYIEDLVIRAPCTNHVFVQWNVYDHLVLPRSLVPFRSEVHNKLQGDPHACRLSPARMLREGVKGLRGWEDGLEISSLQSVVVGGRVKRSKDNAKWWKSWHTRSGLTHNYLFNNYK